MGSPVGRRILDSFVGAVLVGDDPLLVFPIGGVHFGEGLAGALDTFLVFLEVLSIRVVVALLEVRHVVGLHIGVGVLLRQHLPRVLLSPPELLRFVLALEVGELLNLVQDLEGTVELDLGDVPAF